MPILLVALVALLAIGGGALLYFFLAKSQSIESRIVTAVASVTAPAKPATEVPAVAKVAAAEVAAATATAPATASAPAPVAAAPAATTAPLNDVRNAVEGWARAWSERDVDAYLAYYGQGFRPDKGQSRKAWASGRRMAIGKRNSISVAVRDLQLEALAGDRVAARFTQDYSADAYREAGTAKTLVLAREASGWRIVSESATRGASTR
jgi:ketosteroid isomerase-like protein